MLVSTSPRRRELLKSLNIRFRVVRPLIKNEIYTNQCSVEKLCCQNALLKAESRYGKVNKNEILVGADTLVELQGLIFSKPKGKVEVISMLQKLSGKRHKVVTGVALLSPVFGKKVFFVRSFVHFKRLSLPMIKQYSSLKEPYDKAGAYAVQGISSIFIRKIVGSYSNVMGLPTEKLIGTLLFLTGTSLKHWQKND